MATDRFSREQNFNPEKRYVGVRLQQGVPLLDMDWNEQEDIVRENIRSLMAHYIGDGVEGSLVFKIMPTSTPSADFLIGGSGGAYHGAGRALVAGWEVFNPASLRFLEQGSSRAPMTDGPEESLVPVSFPIVLPKPASGSEQYLVYLDVWERYEYPGPPPQGETAPPTWSHMVLDELGLESCLRHKREWAVMISPDENLPASTKGHARMALALLTRHANRNTVEADDIIDLRQTELTLAPLVKEIQEARGSRESLNNRLNISLRANGELRQDSVGTEQIVNDAVTREKIGPGAVGPNEIDDNVILTRHIRPQQIVAPLMADSCLEPQHFSADCVTNRAIAEGSVHAEQIKDGAIASNHLKQQILKPDHFEPGCVRNQAIKKHELDADRLKLGSKQKGEYRMWWSADWRGKEVGCFIPFYLPFAHSPQVDISVAGSSQGIIKAELVSVNNSGFLVRVSLGEVERQWPGFVDMERADKALKEYSRAIASPYFKINETVEKKTINAITGNIDKTKQKVKSGIGISGEGKSTLGQTVEQIKGVLSPAQLAGMAASNITSTFSEAKVLGRLQLRDQVEVARKDLSDLRDKLMKEDDLGDCMLILKWHALLGKAGSSWGRMVDLLNRHVLDELQKKLPARQRYKFEHRLGTALGDMLKDESIELPYAERLQAKKDAIPALVDKVVKEAIVVQSGDEVVIPEHLKSALLDGF